MGCIVSCMCVCVYVCVLGEGTHTQTHILRPDTGRHWPLTVMCARAVHHLAAASRRALSSAQKSSRAPQSTVNNLSLHLNFLLLFNLSFEMFISDNTVHVFPSAINKTHTLNNTISVLSCSDCYYNFFKYHFKLLSFCSFGFRMLQERMESSRMFTSGTNT